VNPIEHAQLGSDAAAEDRGDATGSTDVASILGSFGVRRAVVVVTPSLTNSEILADLIDGFAQTDVALVGVNECPTNRDIDGIVSLGGGSIIRAARESAHALSGARHVAVPTTTSCAEQFGDISAPRPDTVVLDPRGIQSVPREQFVAQAFNAMTFALEAVCESSASVATVASAIEAVSGLRRGLLHAISGETLDSTTAMTMLIAAGRAGATARECKAGVARSIGATLHARSSLSYALCVALVLPFALAFVRRVCADRIASLAPAFEIATVSDEIEAADGVIGAVRRLGLEAGLPRNFRSAGISREAMEFTAKAVPLLPEAAGFIRPVTSSEQIMNEVFRFAW
jgi:alcohol dehydrogenase class IV